MAIEWGMRLSHFRWLNEKLLNSARFQQRQGFLLPAWIDVCPFLPGVNWTEASFAYFKWQMSVFAEQRFLISSGCACVWNLHAHICSLSTYSLYECPSQNEVRVIICVKLGTDEAHSRWQWQRHSIILHIMCLLVAGALTAGEISWTQCS